MAKADYRTRFGDAWDNVARARRELPAYNIERVMFEGGLAFYSDYFSYARTLLRWAEESRKPNGERLPEYIDARKPQIETTDRLRRRRSIPDWSKRESPSGSSSCATGSAPNTRW